MKGPESVSVSLRAMLGRLQAYRVDWRFSFVPSEDEEYEPGIDREVAMDLSDANVISSTRKAYPMDLQSNPERPGEPLRDEGGSLVMVSRHAVLLDIDYPAYLVESSTGGHYHLYLDVPNGVKHEDYMELLKVLAKCGIIEKGYADVSIARGHSDLRLPWVSKGDQKLHPVDAAPAPANTVDFDGHPLPF